MISQTPASFQSFVDSLFHHQLASFQTLAISTYCLSTSLMLFRYHCSIISPIPTLLLPDSYCSRIFSCSGLKVIVILGLSLILIKKHPRTDENVQRTISLETKKMKLICSKPSEISSKTWDSPPRKPVSRNYKKWSEKMKSIALIYYPARVNKTRFWVLHTGISIAQHIKDGR